VEQAGHVAVGHKGPTFPDGRLQRLAMDATMSAATRGGAVR
jgi:hypothetical protein